MTDVTFFSGKPAVRCFVCDKPGHRAADCWWRAKKKCFKCQKPGHEAKDCCSLPKDSQKPSHRVAAVERSDEDKNGADTNQDKPKTSRKTEASVCLTIPEAYRENGYLLFADGSRVPFVPYVKNAGSNQARSPEVAMPVRKGTIGNEEVSVLRDTGCNGILVKQKFVEKNQYTGSYGLMQLADRITREVPIARLHICTPFLSGEVEALCPSDAIYDVIVGNVEGARDANDPLVDQWEANAVTRAGAKRGKQTSPLVIQAEKAWTKIDKPELKRLQADDTSLRKYMESKELSGKHGQLTLSSDSP